MKGFKRLTEAFTMGACPALECFVMGASGGKRTLEQLAEAVEVGGLANLRELDMENHRRTSSRGILALSQAIKRGACPHLEKINCKGMGGRVSRDAMNQLLEALTEVRGQGTVTVIYDKDRLVDYDSGSSESSYESSDDDDDSSDGDSSDDDSS